MTHAERTSPLRLSLLNALWQPTPRKPPKKPDQRCLRVKEPDWVILEVRRLREMRGMTCKNISIHLALQGVAVTPARVISITEYQSRAHLVPEHGRMQPYTPQ